MAGVSGGLRQTSDFLNQLFPFQLPRFVHTLAFDQLGDGRAAGHRRNTAFGAKANVGDALPFQLRLLQAFFQPEAELQNVSACRVFQARDRVGILNFSGVAWVLKVVQQFGGIHRAIVMRRTPSGYASTADAITRGKR